METLTTVESAGPVVSYYLTDADIEATRAKYAALDATTPKGYEEVRLAIGVVRSTRLNVERRRVELKASALDFGRRVDAEAKRLTALIESIEAPLSAKKQLIDEEKARIKAEADAAKLREINAKLEADRAAEDARLKAIRDAEDARLAEERAQLAAERLKLDLERRQAEEVAKATRAAEDARLQVERARLQKIEDAQRAEGEALRAELKRNREADEATARREREKIETERRAVQAEREKAERVEFERLAKIRAEQEAVKKADRDRFEAAERQAKLDALKPDIEKVHAFAATIRALVAPKPRTKDAKVALADAIEALAQVASDLDTFGVA